MNIQSLTLPDKTVPRGEDTYIRITCDASLPLERRLNLLAYVFAKAVQGEVLKRVIQWDLSNGCVQFIVAGNPDWDTPRGKVEVERLSKEEWHGYYSGRTTQFPSAA